MVKYDKGFVKNCLIEVLNTSQIIGVFDLKLIRVEKMQKRYD